MKLLTKNQKHYFTNIRTILVGLQKQMKKIKLILKVASMLPGPLYVGTGLYIAVVGFAYFAPAGDYETAFKSLAGGLPIALAGIVLFLPNRLIGSSRTMMGIGLVSLSILLHHAGGVRFLLDSEDQWLPVMLIVACLLMGLISFLMYLRENRKTISPAIACLIIPLIVGLLGSGNPQWSRIIYMYQAYVDPWSPGPPNRPRCPKTYTGTWTEWFPNGKKKMEKHRLDESYHGEPLKIDWYPSGQTNCTINYVDGKRNYTFWYENGQKKQANNPTDGSLIYWYENGQKKQENDPTDGTVIHWDENGKKREGLFVQMRNSKLRSREAYYKNGKFHGKLTEWDNQGNVSRMVHYDNGKLIEDIPSAPKTEGESEVITNITWKVATGAFDIQQNQLRATERDNYIWTDIVFTDFEINFMASKSPRSDFRINIGSSSSEAYGPIGTFYQILIPWEGGDSRVDFFKNGRTRHISSGYKNIVKEKYAVRLTMQGKSLKVWIDDKLHIDLILNEYTEGYIGFSSFEGITIENIQIKRKIIPNNLLQATRKLEPHLSVRLIKKEKHCYEISNSIANGHSVLPYVYIITFRRERASQEWEIQGYI